MKPRASSRSKPSLDPAFAQGSTACAVAGVFLAADGGKPGRRQTRLVLQDVQHLAARHAAMLLGVADQQHARVVAFRLLFLDQSEDLPQRPRAGQARLVDQDDVAARLRLQFGLVQQVGHGVGRGEALAAEHAPRGAGRRGEGDQLAAALAQGGIQRLQGGRLAGARLAEQHLHPVL